MEGLQMDFYPSSYLICDYVDISVSLWIFVIFFISHLSVLICISIFFVNCNTTRSMAYQELKCTFFKVPEVQKKTVTEEKIHVAVSKKIEPPSKGISDLF